MKKLIKTYQGSGDQKILIISGIHGNELTSIWASVEINKFVHEYKNLAEKITIVIGYNEQAINADVRFVDYDINRTIEVRPELKDLKQLIDESDIIFDLHTSWDCGTFALIDNDENANKILNWCISSNVPYLVRDFPEEGTTLKRYALKQGKIGITFEMPGMNKVNYAQSSVLNEYIKKLLKNKSELTNNTELQIRNAYSLNSNTNGFLKQIVDFGEFLESDEIVGFVFDYEMHKIEEIKTTEAGFLLVGNGRNFVKKGEEVFNVQPIITR